MSPVLAMAEEARQWHEEESGSLAGAAGLCGLPDAWEWATVAVACCGASCGGEGDAATYVEEFAISVSE